MDNKISNTYLDKLILSWYLVYDWSICTENQLYFWETMPFFKSQYKNTDIYDGCNFSEIPNWIDKNKQKQR